MGLFEQTVIASVLSVLGLIWIPLGGMLVHGKLETWLGVTDDDDGGILPTDPTGLKAVGGALVLMAAVVAIAVVWGQRK